MIEIFSRYWKKIREEGFPDISDSGLLFLVVTLVILLLMKFL